MYICIYVSNATGMQLFKHTSCGRGVAAVNSKLGVFNSSVQHQHVASFQGFA